jgi:hypothetical protein
MECRANILNKSRDGRQGVALQLGGFGEGLTTLCRRNVTCYETEQRASDMDR